MKKLFVATKNKGKLKEIAEILKPIEVLSAFDVINENVDVEESGATFEENAKLKGETLSKFVEGYIIADDSGLEVDALNGAPGVFSARFAGENATDEENNRLLLDKLKGVPLEKRGAKFVCVIALCKDGETVATFRGECEGRIAFEMRGSNGFGYDPLFLLSDGRTMAELEAEEKNEISHRRKALEQLKFYLNNEF
ncbi:XTP/dITP diphosphatase [Deferribacter autotrophicus]|uniref:dITP/XTP pyrophosphatase n=1 Tax=Deferribacter autotrophicus TaxID=500465 RepID=A0A5A8F318_9BACT|nr:XTP/dITP diphosphatase [Deferribacter autotrophicus]KAA0258397.1 XTP/dITP diphosphatase [Deferribacter autotrophicus]